LNCPCNISELVARVSVVDAEEADHLLVLAPSEKMLENAVLIVATEPLLNR
jgi:hypothetical protein